MADPINKFSAHVTQPRSQGGSQAMLYATGIFVPDPFIFLEHRGRKIVVVSDLEIDRVKKKARVDRVLSVSHYQRKLKRLGIDRPRLVDVLNKLLNELLMQVLII